MLGGVIPHAQRLTRHATHGSLGGSHQPLTAFALLFQVTGFPIQPTFAPILDSVLLKQRSTPRRGGRRSLRLRPNHKRFFLLRYPLLAAARTGFLWIIALLKTRSTGLTHHQRPLHLPSGQPNVGRESASTLKLRKCFASSTRLTGNHGRVHQATPSSAVATCASCPLCPTDRKVR